MKNQYYIGLMSGTSLDGIDAGLYDFNDQTVKSVCFHYQHYPSDIKTRLRQICNLSNNLSLENLGALEQQLSELYAQACLQLLKKSGVSAEHIQAIGSHGQTLCHFPNHSNPFSLQIGDANIISQRTGITTVADFRRRDIAAGGQGAPLVPSFHQAVFHSDTENRAILNIGGIANITILPKDPQKPVHGFDTGVGNSLMDIWVSQYRHKSYDQNGAWAMSGKLIPTLLQTLKSDPYFSRIPPKSTGTEYFSRTWLQNKLSQQQYKATDIQRTLCQFTAETIAEALLNFAPETERIFICGGGIHNLFLINTLQKLLKIPLLSTAELGIEPDEVEAMAFAWLAKQTLAGKQGNLPSVTGATQPVILGGIYQA